MQSEKSELSIGRWITIGQIVMAGYGLLVFGAFYLDAKLKERRTKKREKKSREARP